METSAAVLTGQRLSHMESGLGQSIDGAAKHDCLQLFVCHADARRLLFEARGDSLHTWQRRGLVGTAALVETFATHVAELVGVVLRL